MESLSERYRQRMFGGSALLLAVVCSSSVAVEEVLVCGFPAQLLPKDLQVSGSTCELSQGMRSVYDSMKSLMVRKDVGDIKRTKELRDAQLVGHFYRLEQLVEAARMMNETAVVIGHLDQLKENLSLQFCRRFCPRCAPCRKPLSELVNVVDRQQIVVAFSIAAEFSGASFDEWTKLVYDGYDGTNGFSADEIDLPIGEY